ncbi:hypothetical protein NE235_18835 [Actinoallomurus spadix]|uniref:PA14 domain-containing protein n=1 Tax=Actinoallomurus spadix TaxID=79912 RepID=A0ABN0VZY3_9ACTN|nr:hypothetical protein [Actinoallomurus spadix]MCO5988162.1 hypothetical protein [Actinoallomurus spadix]
MTPAKKRVTAVGTKAGGTSEKRAGWFKGLSTWSKTALVGPVVATVVGAAILKIVGLADGGGPAAGPKPDLKAPPVLINRLGIEHVESEASMATGTVMNAAQVARLNQQNGYNRDVYSPAGDQRLRALGAANVNVSMTTLAVTGNRGSLVRVTNIRALAQCQAPLTGTLFFSPTAGSTYSAKIGFDLDKPNPFAQNVVDDPTEETPPRFTGTYFPDHEYDLAPGEPATFVLTARTTKHYCRYRYQFDLLVNGKPATQVVDDHGRPFEVTAQAFAYSRARERTEFSSYRALYVSPLLMNGRAQGWSAADPATFTY